MKVDAAKQWLVDVEQRLSPHHDDRPIGCEISLIVIHSISLPPGEYGGIYIDQLFQGKLDAGAHPFFPSIEALKVSTHILIRRDGSVVQYVPLDKRAWHAGKSNFDGRPQCNDYSIGIELEGTSDSEFEPTQYQKLIAISKAIMAVYPAITIENITGHQHIAPTRKQDPGEFFDWDYFRSALAKALE